MKEKKDGLLVSLRKRNLKNNVSVPSLLLNDVEFRIKLEL